MVQLVMSRFVPVKVHVKQQPRTFERFQGLWTPTQLVLDANGREHYRLEGFLPAGDFLAELELGLAKLELEEKHYEVAAREFRAVCEHHPDAAAAPQACYWAGVSEYKANHVGGTLQQTLKMLQERYPGSEWTRRAEVWAA